MENPIIDFYNNYDEEKRLTRKSHMPEYLITMKYIEKYLTENSKILEIGAGTGRYSIAFAEKGYDVTAVELAKHNIDVMKKKVKANHNIKIFEGNAVDLSFLPSDTFDMVLLLGPMYHLFTDEDKHKALSEAVRVAKRGAVIYASYCNNDTCVYKMFYDKRILSYVDRGLIEENFNTKSAPNEIFELYRKSDIDELMKNYNVTRLHFVGVDMLSYIFNNRFDRLNKKEFELYVKFIEEICEREDLVGFSMHMLDVFRKD
ncbi:MAG: class I SAM-dependent methyltransferase [Clostridiales bacterium]|nr:class I SAM-dependent methyltransferase [Clostridiales bacterium]